MYNLKEKNRVEWNMQQHKKSFTSRASLKTRLMLSFLTYEAKHTHTLILCEIQLARTYSSISSLHFTSRISVYHSNNLHHPHKSKAFSQKFLSHLKFRRLSTQKYSEAAVVFDNGMDFETLLNNLINSYEWVMLMYGIIWQKGTTNIFLSPLH